MTVLNAAELLRLLGEAERSGTGLVQSSPIVSATAAPATQPDGDIALARRWRCHVTTQEHLERVAALLALEQVIALDLETYTSDSRAYPDGALDPHVGHVRLVSMVAEDVDPESGARVARVAFLIDAMALSDWPGVLAPLLANAAILKVGHNLRFDLKFLMKAGLEVDNLFDTMLAAQLLDGGRHLKERGYFTLAAVAERYLGSRLPKTEQTSNWGAPTLTEGQLTYAARDVLVLLPLRRVLLQELQKHGLMKAADLEMEALPCVAWLELVGAPFDGEAWMALSDKAMRRKLALEEEVRSIFTQALATNPPVAQRVNLDSPAQVKQALAGTGIPLANTTEESLAAVAHQHPVVQRLLDYREAGKLADTYGIEFLNHIHPTTDRIHADYHQIGAVSGRMACSSPNLQQVPRLQDYRACFRSGAGRVLVKADLSLIELCVAAELSGDVAMIQAVTERKDLHRLTAAALFGKTSEAVTPNERAFGKAVNFGTLFGQGRSGLVRLAAQHSLALSELQAREFQQRFARAWPQLAAWQRQEMRSTAPEVRTASGRVRLLEAGAPGTIRANTPVQGTAADGFKAALARLWTTRKRVPTASPVLAVHDELVVECDEAEAEAAAQWVTECLVDGMGRYLKRVPIRVEVRIARSWAGESGG